MTVQIWQDSQTWQQGQDSKDKRTGDQSLGIVQLGQDSGGGGRGQPGQDSRERTAQEKRELKVNIEKINLANLLIKV
jgi:hypothetical protein